MAVLKKFVHPHGAYRLDYPADWENLQQDDARSCGFGPHERNNVGLWISIIPMSIDTDRLVDDLPGLMQQSIGKSEGANLRPDKTLKHYGLKADVVKEGEGGHYWILAGGDLVLFASTQVPIAERDEWNPIFDRVMASLQITRDEELLLRKAHNELIRLLRDKYPDQDFKFDEKGIRGKDRLVYLSNLNRDVRASPGRWQQVVHRFLEGLSQSAEAHLGTEQWDECHKHILPVLKPRDYINPETPTRHLLISDWLLDVVICYVIKSERFFRFVTGWDANRWGVSPEDVHKLAIENLGRLDWPKRMEGSRQRDGGRLILIDTPDGLASSRLLHPELHRLFSGPLGSPFWAGIPDRTTLVVYSDRRSLKQRIGRQIKKDHHKSAYPITPVSFLVTADGIAPPAEKE